MRLTVLKNGRQAGLCLAAGVALAFASATPAPWAMVSGTWLYPLFLLRFTRLAPPLMGYLIVSAALAAIVLATGIGVMPLPLIGIATTALFGGALGGLAFLVDRLLAPRLPAAFAHLIFPAALVSVFYAGAQGGPFGSWGDPSYGAGLAGTAGLVATTGLWGVTFVIGWLASGINQALERGVRHGAPIIATWAAIMIIAAAYGALADRSAPRGRTLVAAAVTPAFGMESAFECPRIAGCRSAVSQKRQDDLFARSEAAVRQGARLVLWSEAAAHVLEADEAALIARGRAFAVQHQIYLVMGAGTIPAAFPRALVENKLIAITPAGEIAWEYLKTKPVPGEPIVAGPGRVPVLDTPFGRIAAVICYDADFPDLVRQAGRNRADILLVSANDWPRIAAMHADMARYRAVENGVSLVRAASNGHSIMNDAGGRELARADGTAKGGELLLAHIPVGRRAPLYPLIGDAFAWACAALLLAASAWTIARRRQSAAT